MLTVHLLGHAHVTYNNRPVPLSAKAVALITYLTIEKLPQHRERLADLLWNTPEARKNLRVELARIRSAGLNIFPLSRQLLYLEHVETDLNVWLTQLGTELDQAGLAQWLSTLRGVPLSGLEDLGSPAFQEWIDHQRWVLTEQTEAVLGRAYERFYHAGKFWATRAVAARAEALGFSHPGEFLPEPGGLEPDGAPAASPPAAALPLPSRVVPAVSPVSDRSPAEVSALQSDAEGAACGELHFEDAEREAALRDSLWRAAHQPQLIVLHGPTGSGKSYGAERALAQGNWLALRVSNSRMGRLVLATLAQSLLAALSDGGSAAAPLNAPLPLSAEAETLRGVLLHPGTLEEDVVKVATVLATVSRPVAIVLDHAHNGPVELASLLEFLLNVPAAGPRALMMLSRTPPSQAPLCRALLRRFSPGQCLLLEVTPLSVGSVVQALETRGGATGPALHAQAAVMLQRSEGNPLHLLSLLEQTPLKTAAVTNVGPAGAPGWRRPPPGSRLPAAVRDTYLAEIDGWPAPLRDALSSLSVIQGDFSFGLVGTFPDAVRRGLAPAVLLREALERRALTETEPPSALSLPGFGTVGDAVQEEPSYRFRSESLRVALASLLPQAERQDVRRHLAASLEATQPGLALYYAERAGGDSDTEQLRRAYQAQLPVGSPLRQLSLGPAPQTGAAQLTSAQLLTSAQTAARHLPPAREPVRTHASASPTISWQGYLLSWEQGGWLSVLSQGRHGHPQTLRLHLPIPSGLRAAAPLKLRLVWRLDVYHGGQELGPTQVPFPLRLAWPGVDGARVLTPEALPDYTEDGQHHQIQSDVALGTWLEHELNFVSVGQALGHLEISTRALDLALTIAELSVNGQSLLPLTVTPERLGRTQIREWSAPPPPVVIQG